MATFRLLVVFAVLCASPLTTLAAKLPDDITRCDSKDASFSECLQKAIEASLPRFQNGEASLGVPMVDPLHVDSINLDLGEDGPIPLVIHATNINVTGLTKSMVKSAKMDLNTFTLSAETLTPRIHFYFDYTAHGRILLVQIRGDGPAFITLDDVIGEHVITGTTFEKKGKTYWNVTEHKINLTPKMLKCNFEGLFKGDPRVSTQVNKFLNTEWKTFWQQIKKQAEDVFTVILTQITNRVFGRVPIKDVFLNA